MTTLTRGMLDEAWTALGGAPELADRVRWTGPEQNLLPSALPVSALAGAAVGVAGLAATELIAGSEFTGPEYSRAETAGPGLIVHAGAVAAAFGSERHLRIDREPWVGFAPLSRFWKTADGRVRTHGNYPHHRAALLRALSVESAVDDVVAAVAGVLAGSATGEVADRITEAGGLAVPVHTPEEWVRHDQGAAVARLPLLSLRRVGDAASAGPSSSGDSQLPAAGLRVLDLTRVISGPVATRTLGHLGADVLRVDDPRLPELREQHLDTGFGKRSTLLDLDRREDRARFDDLVDAADVVVTGYHPGALDRHGLDPAALLERRPSLIIARLSAWSGVGPWAGRRGFDSLVQAVSGIAVLEARRSGDDSGSGKGSGSGDDSGWTPGALPVQALDHATGYLLAAAVLRAQTNRRTQGGGWVAELSLAQTAAWLLRHVSDSDVGEEPRTSAYGSCDLSPWLAEVDTPDGRIRHALPPITIDGVLPRDWRRPVGPWGGDEPVWLPR